MKISLLALAIVLLAGCDIDKNKTINENNLIKLTSICNKNDGFKEAQRVQITLIDDWEWRVTCKDGCYRDWETDRKSTRLNSSHSGESRMPSSA